MIEGLNERIHCMGAGGAGMLPLAIYLAQSGHRVTAEDDSFNERSRRMLSQAGVELTAPTAFEGITTVHSSAISKDHPKLQASRRAGSDTLRRGECLALVAREKRLVAVAGSHGKTTTCGMLADIFDAAGVSADFILGAQFEEGLPCRASGSDWLIAEIDESDGTIEQFAPEIVALLNADHDHHARYQTKETYYAALVGLVCRCTGVAVIDADLKPYFAAKERDEPKPRIQWVGDDGDFRCAAKAVDRGLTEVSIEHETEKPASFLINRTGEGNARNAAFAYLAAREAGAELASGTRLSFRPIRRRQRCHFCSPEIRVYEDYAHHPREIDALLDSLGDNDRGKRVIVFQPHRYSRTRELKADFARSLSRCDALILIDVYAASEAPQEGGTGKDLFDACRASGVNCQFAADEASLFEMLGQTLDQAPATVLFVGAGVGDRLAETYAGYLETADTQWGGLYRAIANAGSFATEISRDEPLANKTTLRVGGTAERYFEPASLDELKAALKACRAAGIRVNALGRGSNLIVPDEGVAGLVIRLAHSCWSYFEVENDGDVRVGAGLRIKVLCGRACKAGLKGYEFLDGIPGCVGGVLRMNAGAMGNWAFDIVKSIRYVNMDGEVIEAGKGSLTYGYRFCRELENAIAIEATLNASQGTAPAKSIRRVIDTYQEKRRETQPREPSAGCVFKNPEEGSAGRLIDQLGLKGTVFGGAEISTTHGNFIINRGGATSEDVLALVRFARRVARERRGVELRPEALLFGSDWEEALRQ